MDESTIQLFRQEVQELLQQIGQSLTTWIESPSQANQQRLIRLVELIYKGAMQMNIMALERPAIRFLTLLQTPKLTDIIAVPHESRRQITQLYAELRQAGITSPIDQQAPQSRLETEEASEITHQTSPTQTVPSPTSPETFKMESLDRDTLETEQSVLSEPEVEPFEAAHIEFNQVVLSTEFAHVLHHLKESLSTLSTEDLVQDLQAQADSFHGWSSVLNWPDLSAIATTLVEGLNASPTAAKHLGNLALVGLQALQREALLKLDWAGGSHLSLNSEASAKNFPVPQSAAGRDRQAIIPQTRRFSTEKQFIWRTDSLLFTVPSDCVQEILIPKQNQILKQGQEQRLAFHKQSIPVIELMEYLQARVTSEGGINLPSRDRPGIVSSQGVEDNSFSQQPFLVIKTPHTVMALVVEIQQFIREPFLELQKKINLPTFSLGETTSLNQSGMVMVDVLALLANRQDIAIKAKQSNTGAVRFSSQNTVADSSATTLSDEPNVSSSATQVLIVDDSRTVRYFLKRTFESAGYVVCEAQDGLEAITQLDKNPHFQLMVSDVEMPNLNGFELLTHCRRKTAWAELPIIILSQCDTDQHQQLALQFGANAYFTKPYDETQFLHTVSSVLEGG